MARKPARRPRNQKYQPSAQGKRRSDSISRSTGNVRTSTSRKVFFLSFLPRGGGPRPPSLPPPCEVRSTSASQASPARQRRGARGGGVRTRGCLPRLLSAAIVPGATGAAALHGAPTSWLALLRPAEAVVSGGFDLTPHPNDPRHGVYIIRRFGRPVVHFPMLVAIAMAAAVSVAVPTARLLDSGRRRPRRRGTGAVRRDHQ